MYLELLPIPVKSKYKDECILIYTLFAYNIVSENTDHIVLKV